MVDNETIDAMLSRFTKITNWLSFLSDKIDSVQKVRKVIRALPKAWEVKTTTLKELNDREEMDFSGFIRNLKTPEIKMELHRTHQKKSITFNATPLIVKDKESTDEGEEDFTMLIGRVWKMFYKKGKKSNFRRTRP